VFDEWVSFPLGLSKHSNARLSQSVWPGAPPLILFSSMNPPGGCPTLRGVRRVGCDEVCNSGLSCRFVSFRKRERQSSLSKALQAAWPPTLRKSRRVGHPLYWFVGGKQRERLGHPAAETWGQTERCPTLGNQKRIRPVCPPFSRRLLFPAILGPTSTLFVPKSIVNSLNDLKLLIRTVLSMRVV